MHATSPEREAESAALSPGDLVVDTLGLGGWREGGEPTQGSPTLLHDASRLRPVAARRERAHKGPIAGFAHRVELDELPRLCARVVGAVPAEIGLRDELERSIRAVGERTPLPDDPGGIVTRQKATDRDLQRHSSLRPRPGHVELTEGELGAVQRCASPFVVDEDDGRGRERVPPDPSFDVEGGLDGRDLAKP